MPEYWRRSNDTPTFLCGVSRGHGVLSQDGGAMMPWEIYMSPKERAILILANARAKVTVNRACKNMPSIRIHLIPKGENDVLFKVSMRCNVCDWNCTVYTTDTEKALLQADVHETIQGHSVMPEIDMIEETVQ